MTLVSLSSALVRRLLVLMTAAVLLSACAHRPADLLAQRLAQMPAQGVVQLGEQHDAAEHQQLLASLTQALAGQDKLAALVLEMAEAGSSTAGLPSTANDEQVRKALRWDVEGWPWKAYGPGVMAAVRAGVPVYGGNLPRSQFRSVMADASLDQRLSAAGLTEQDRRMDEGHCGLLPASQLRPMTRIQIARDLSMAQQAQAQVQPARLVLLWTGSFHADLQVGVPVHMQLAPSDRRVVQLVAGGAGDSQAPAGGSADLLWATAAAPFKDHCAALRDSMGAKPGSAGAHSPSGAAAK